MTRQLLKRRSWSTHQVLKSGEVAVYGRQVESALTPRNAAGSLFEFGQLDGPQIPVVVVVARASRTSSTWVGTWRTSTPSRALDRPTVGSPGLRLSGVTPARHGERRDAPKATAIATHPRGGEWLELDRWNPGHPEVPWAVREAPVNEEHKAGPPPHDGRAQL
jgi:hypothetical protein